MSDAFEQWAADKSFMLRVSAGDGYVNVREMALEAWQAALQHSESEQESYTYSPDGKMRINKNGNFGF